MTEIKKTKELVLFDLEDSEEDYSDDEPETYNPIETPQQPQTNQRSSQPP